MPPSDDTKKSWMESEDQLWADVRRHERRRRDFFWILFGLLLLLLGSYTGFPGRFFT